MLKSLNQELDMSQQPVAQLWRYDVSVADGSYTERCLVQRAFEFPSVHPVYAGQHLSSPVHLLQQCSLLPDVPLLHCSTMLLACSVRWAATVI